MSLIKNIIVTLIPSLVSQNYASAHTVGTPIPNAEGYSTGKVDSDASHFGEYDNKANLEIGHCAA